MTVNQDLFILDQICSLGSGRLRDNPKERGCFVQAYMMHYPLPNTSTLFKRESNFFMNVYRINFAVQRQREIIFSIASVHWWTTVLEKKQTFYTLVFI